MKDRRLSFAIALLLLFALGPPGLAADLSPAPEGERNAARVLFGQWDWLAEDGTPLYPCSNRGYAQFVFGHRSQQLLEENGGGWVNLVIAHPLDPSTEPLWVVRNLYFAYPDMPAMRTSSPTVDFGLGVPIALCVSRISYQAFITPMPLIDAPLLIAPSTRRVTHDGYLAGGRCLDESHVCGGSYLAEPGLFYPDWSGWSPPPPVPPPGPLPIAMADGRFPRIDEGVDGCAPASAARSIDYLMNKAGVAHGNPQDMYDGLYGDMQTTSPGGTQDGNMLSGKNTYCGNNGLPITSGLNYGPGHLGSAMGTLAAGGDVELLISWNPQGTGGGHAATVTSITQLPNGGYQITYVDDPWQGDGVAQNQTHTITTDASGNFPGGVADGVMQETISP